MNPIDARLNALGFPPADDLDEESSNMVEYYSETIDPTMAALAARGWVCAWDPTSDGIEAELDGVMEEILERAGLDLAVNLPDDDGPVSIGDEHFEPASAGDESFGAFAEQMLDLVAFVLERRGWVLVEGGDGMTIFHVVLPRECWEALDPEWCTDLEKREPRARPVPPPPPPPPGLQN
jgi:hypothetical protein